MRSNTIFRWFVNKLTFIALLIVFTASWWRASLKHEDLKNRLKTELLVAAFEATNASSLDGLSANDFNYSILNAEGVIVSDKKFGSMASSAQSNNFTQAISGKSLVSITNIDGVDRIECWARIKFNNSPHVIVLRQDVTTSKVQYFFSSFAVFIAIAIIVLLCSASVVTNPIQNAITDLNTDLKDIYSEKFDKKQASIDTAEFSELYESYNHLSSFVQAELGSLRADLKQWGVFFSTMPRGLIAIDDQRTIHNCNANSLDLLNVKDQKISKLPGQSIMAVFRNADLNKITSEFLAAGSFLEEYEFELDSNNIIETI